MTLVEYGKIIWIDMENKYVELMKIDSNLIRKDSFISLSVLYSKSILYYNNLYKYYQQMLYHNQSPYYRQFLSSGVNKYLIHLFKEIPKEYGKS
jgi:hypothetical protein